MRYFKTVLVPMQIIVGKTCRGNGAVCAHFDDEYGFPTCALGFSISKKDKNGVWELKPKECLDLKEVENVYKRKE